MFARFPIELYAHFHTENIKSFMRAKLDLATADTRVSPPSNWTIRSSADGFCRSSLEQ